LAVLVAAFLILAAMPGAADGAWVPKPTATARPTKPPAPWMATATAKAALRFTTTTPPPTRTPTATATPALPTATSTAGSAPDTDHPIRVVGSAAYQAAAEVALDQMRWVTPDIYRLVTAELDEIRESDQNWAWGGSRYVEVSMSSMGYGPAFAGSSIYHETLHLYRYRTGQFPAFGCDAESIILAQQAQYLARHGDPGLAQWARSLKGVWGC